MSKELWKKKLDSFVPANVYGDTEYTDAILWGLAAVLCTIEETSDFHVAQAFITQAERAYLLEHGAERNVDIIDGELTSTYATRIRQLTNKVSCPDIKAVVDELLEVGECDIVEDHMNSMFFNRDVFFNRNDLLIDNIQNAFSILVDNQAHDPYSFADSDFFADRDSHAGHIRSNLELFNLIIEAVNAAKACGTAYRIIERN